GTLLAAAALENAVPVILLTKVTIVRKMLEQSAAQLKRLQITLDRVEDLTVGSDECGEWDRPFPAGPECGDCLGRVVTIQEQIPIERMLLLQKSEHKLLLVRAVDAHRHNVYLTLCIHADHLLE